MATYTIIRLMDPLIRCICLRSCWVPTSSDSNVNSNTLIALNNGLYLELNYVITLPMQIDHMQVVFSTAKLTSYSGIYINLSVQCRLVNVKICQFSS
jgi:hypothetical protein